MTEARTGASVGLRVLGAAAAMAAIGIAVKQGRAERAARRELRELIRSRDSLLRRGHDPVAFLDQRLRITSSSIMFGEMFDVDADLLRGRDVTLLVKARDGQPLLPILEEAEASRTELRVSGIRAGDEEFPLSLRAVDLREGGKGGWFLILSDLSQQTHFDRLKSDFVSTVSHELRTPLSSIAGALGLVAAGATGDIGDDTADMVGIALNNTNRLIRLINDLLDIQRIESGRMHFDIQPRSLRDLIQAALDEIKPFADDHQVGLEFTPDEGRDGVLADADRVVRVFTNLLSNAIKFSPTGGTVCVRMRLRAGFHRIDVIDNGPGIPESFRGKVFDKFAQADGSGTRKIGGTGLGLAISREIVDRLDGKLWFADNPEGGTIFSVDLPVSEIGAKS